MIYIDPPFNTSQTFASYEDNLEHSIWLTMMRDRLLNLKKLLADSGSIWVHLDDAEEHRMRLLMDEVFGGTNFVSEIAWEKTFKPRNDAKLISGRHDIILVYRKTESFFPNKLPRTSTMNSAYRNPDNDSNGAWTSAPATAPGALTHQGMVFAVQHPITGQLLYPPSGQCWRFGQERFLEILRQWNPKYELVEIDDAGERAAVCGIDESEVRPGVAALIVPGFTSEPAERLYEEGPWPLVYITSGGHGGFRRKTYLRDMDDRAIEDMWFQTEVGSNDEAKNEIKSLIRGVNPFSTPKPERLLERIIHIGSNPGDIVLDCFAGSGTTAAVAQKMGRRWVTCELLDTTFNTFTKPRLEMVVNDRDPGGITRTKGERVPADGVELPDGVSADDAAKFASVLNKLVSDDPELKKSPAVKELKSRSKTKRSKGVVNWRGGGGFQVAHLAPACFDYDKELDRVVLTEAATGELLVRSVAANLGFSLLEYGDWDAYDGYYFEGYRGNTVLKVWEGIADTELVDWLVSRLHEGQNMVLAATQALDGVREHLRRARRGSRLILIPDELFTYSKGGAR